MPISEEILTQIEHTFEASINLCGQGYNDDDVIKIAMAIQKNPYIIRVDLRDNKISDRGAEALSKLEGLVELDLSNGIHRYEDHVNDITQIGAKYLAASGLKKLNFEGNIQIGDEGAKFLAENKTLIELNLNCCGITAIGGKIMLSAKNSIEILSMESNAIGNEGLQTRINDKLKKLYLADCGISFAGIKALAHNKTLLSVSLHENPLDAAAIDFLKDFYEDSFGQNFSRSEDFIQQLQKKTFSIRSSSAPERMQSEPSVLLSHSLTNTEPLSNTLHSPSPTDRSELSSINTEFDQGKPLLIQSKRTQRSHSDGKKDDSNDSKKPYSPIADRSSSNSNESLILSLEKTDLNTDGETTPIHRNSI